MNTTDDGEDRYRITEKGFLCLIGMKLAPAPENKRLDLATQYAQRHTVFRKDDVGPGVVAILTTPDGRIFRGAGADRHEAACTLCSAVYGDG